MWIKVYDSPGEMEVKRIQKSKFHPALISIRCLGMGYLTVSSAIILRTALTKFIDKHQKKK